MIFVSCLEEISSIMFCVLCGARFFTSGKKSMEMIVSEDHMTNHSL